MGWTLGAGAGQGAKSSKQKEQAACETKGPWREEGGGPGWDTALSLGSKGEWDTGLEKVRGGRFLPSPIPFFVHSRHQQTVYPKHTSVSTTT